MEVRDLLKEVGTKGPGEEAIKEAADGGVAKPNDHEGPSLAYCKLPPYLNAIVANSFITDGSVLLL